ncbi:hypothetical protein BHE74_00051709 [Ensete ventricosum]|nr:hypothetical protein BHE74_00051709 [Ensete ventricosum]RZS10081.1 hypothetical protein BHM03_00041236 [Ensete ventricosum]
MPPFSPLLPPPFRDPNIDPLRLKVSSPTPPIPLIRFAVSVRVPDQVLGALIEVSCEYKCGIWSLRNCIINADAERSSLLVIALLIHNGHPSIPFALYIYVSVDVIVER